MTTISVTTTAIIIGISTGAPPYLVFIVQIQHLILTILLMSRNTCPSIPHRKLVTYLTDSLRNEYHVIRRTKYAIYFLLFLSDPFRQSPSVSLRRSSRIAFLTRQCSSYISSHDLFCPVHITPFCLRRA